LIFTLGAASSLANPIPDLDTRSNPAGTVVNSPSKNEKASHHKSNEKLRADVEKLLSDARAGKVVPPERRQMKPAKSNSLSKGAKIAIGVGVAVVVIALIVKYQKDHLFDGFRLGN
jgi:hypothetical protein